MFTKDDAKAQIHINLDYAKHASDPQLRAAAIKLAQFFMTQLTEAERRQVLLAQNINLEGF